MTERPRLRADLLAERADGVVEMMAPDGVAVLQLYEVEAAVACGMDGSRDASALVVWARLELGLAVSEAELRAVMAALAAAGCLADGDADLANAASPFDSMPAIRPAAVLDVSRAMSAEIHIEDVELPEPGPDMGGVADDEDEDDEDNGADEFRDEPTLTTPPEVLARAAEDAAAAAAAAAAVAASSRPRAASSGQRAASSEPSAASSGQRLPVAAVAAAPAKPPTRDTPRGYEAIAAAVKASVAGKTPPSVPRPAPVTAAPPVAQPQKRKRESIPPLDKTKTLRPEALAEDERPTLSPDAEPAAAVSPQLFTTMRGGSAAATAPRPAPMAIPTAMMPSVGRLPALSQTLRPEPIDSPTLRPEPIDSPTLRPEDDFDIDHTSDDVVTLPPANTAPADDQINSPSDTIGGMVAPRFCMTCGVELLAGVRFCVACGTPVVNMMADAEAEPPPLEPPPAVVAPAVVAPPRVAPPPAVAVAPPVAPVPEPGPPSYATPRRLEAPAMRTPVAVAIPPRASSQPSSSPPPIAAATPAVVPQRASMPVLRRSSLVPILVAIGLVALAAVAAFVLWQR